MAENASGLVRVYYKGNVADKETGTPAHPGGPEDMFPIDAQSAVSRFPNQWSFKPWDDSQKAVPVPAPDGPVTIVDPALDATDGPGNDPKPGDTDIAANRRGKKAD